MVIFEGKVLFKPVFSSFHTSTQNSNYSIIFVILIKTENLNPVSKAG